MDPDSNLEEMLSDAAVILAAEDMASPLEIAMAERIIALDEWIRKGGFLPNRWNR